MKRFFIFSFYILFSLFVFIFLSNLFVYITTKSYIHDGVEGVVDADVALIPGAGVSTEGVLSLVFRDRIDTAIDLYQAGKVSKILVSGDNSTVNYNEVSPVRLYLIDKGIPDENIFLDHAGFDTYSTLYRARDIFSVSSMIITTQSFHLPRAVFIARRLGIEAFGINSDKRPFFYRHYFREMLATEKALLNLLFKREPKYLGEEMPITKSVVE